MHIDPSDEPGEEDRSLLEPAAPNEEGGETEEVDITPPEIEDRIPAEPVPASRIGVYPSAADPTGIEPPAETPFPSEPEDFPAEGFPQGTEEPVSEDLEDAQAESYSPDAAYSTPDHPPAEEPAVSFGPAKTAPQRGQPRVGVYPPLGASPEGAYRQPAKDPSLALVLELLPGFFGLLGFGWIYTGQVTTGVLLLAGFLLWNMLALFLDLITISLFLCLHIPINLTALLLSGILLNNHIKNHPEIFGLPRQGPYR
jgi:hypothetical protein